MRPSALLLLFIGMAVALAIWLVSTNFWQLAGFAFVYGMIYGAWVAVLPAVVMDHFGGRNVSGIIGILYTSVAFGFLGALFSRLITLQRQWSAMALDELYNARAYHYIILRASIGVLGALVVFFFLQSGLVQGKVFPNFSELSMTSVHFSSAVGEQLRWPTRLLLPSADLALLIMWSFLAGFSESLVPTVLSGTERQFGAAAAPRQ